jgi:hypothetical protein
MDYKTVSSLLIEFLQIFLYFFYFCIDILIFRIKLLHFFEISNTFHVAAKFLVALTPSQVTFYISRVISNGLCTVPYSLGVLVQFHEGHGSVRQNHTFQFVVLFTRLLLIKFFQTLGVSINGLFILAHLEMNVAL